MLTDENQRGDFYSEQRRRCIGARRKSYERARHSEGGSGLDNGSYRFNRLRILLKRFFIERRLQEGLREPFHPLLFHCTHLISTLYFPFIAVGFAARIAEHQAAEPLRLAFCSAQHNIPTHGKPYGDNLRELQV